MDELFTVEAGIGVVAVYLLAEIVFGFLPHDWFGEGQGRRKLAVVVVAAFVVNAVVGDLSVAPQDFLRAGLALAVQAIFANEALRALLPGETGDGLVSGAISKQVHRDD